MVLNRYGHAPRKTVSASEAGHERETREPQGESDVAHWGRALCPCRGANDGALEILALVLARVHQSTSRSSDQQGVVR